MQCSEAARKERPDLWSVIELAKDKKKVLVHDVDKLGRPKIGSQPALSLWRIGSIDEVKQARAKALKGTSNTFVSFATFQRSIGVRAS